MKTYPTIVTRAVSLVLCAFLLLGLAGCEKEVLRPESESDARLKALADRFGPDMPLAEFEELYALVGEKTAAELAGKPTLQADISNREYLLTYSNQVRIEIGGAVYFKDRNEVQGGTTVGGVTLPPSLFAQLDAAATHQIRLRIRDPFTWAHLVFGLRQVIMTDTENGGPNYYGLYNVNSKEYLFLNVGGSSGNIGNTACGAIGLGKVSGKVAPPYQNLTQGEVAYGIIAGCTPVIIGASITFFYTGQELP